jgi:ELWxxDGT repeat protein
MVKDIVAAFGQGAEPEELTAFDGKIYFSAEDDVVGRELWTSDGTDNGTGLVTNIDMTSADSSPGELLVAGSSLYFGASDGINGRELWKSDGSAAGTVLVADIHPTASANPHRLRACNDRVYFLGRDGYAGNDALWSSDGTDAGTVLLADAPDPVSAFECVGEVVVYETTAADDTARLWVADGSGSRLLKDLYPGEDYYIDLFRVVDGELYFGARAATDSHAMIWKTDGTAAGTTIVTDTAREKYAELDVYGSEFNHYELDGRFLFTYGPALLWRTDGTEEGTVLLKDMGE